MHLKHINRTCIRTADCRKKLFIKKFLIYLKIKLLSNFNYKTLQLNHIQHFRLKQIGLQQLQRTNNTKMMTTEDLTYVSVHVRMSDYPNHLRITYDLPTVSDDYFIKAFQHFRGQYNVKGFVL